MCLAFVNNNSAERKKIIKKKLEVTLMMVDSTSHGHNSQAFVPTGGVVGLIFHD